MKNIIILFSAALFAISPISYSAEPDIDLHVKCLYPVVMIKTGFGLGTGTVIYSKKSGSEFNNIVLTCAHVVQDYSDLKILTLSYKNWSKVDDYKVNNARLYYVDYEKDIALVLFKSSERMHDANISFDEKIYIGNKVYSFGFGDGLPIPRLDRGEITGVDLPYTADVGVFRSNIYVLTGDSGSSVMYNNKIVGVRFALVQKEGKELNHDALIVPIKYLKDMSDELGGALDFIWSDINGNPSLESYVLNEVKMSDKVPTSVPNPESGIPDDYDVPPPAP